MFRQDYRINKIFLPFLPPARRAYASESKKAKASYLLEGRRSLIAPTKQK